MSRPKKVSYTLIPIDEAPGPEMYGMLERVREEAHEELLPARVALAWCTSWKADVDSRVILGKCKKASDLDRELHRFDFVILLNAEWWQDAAVKDHMREALLDHELSHAAPKMGEDGEQVEDERGRKVWRTRKHDIEEFSGVVERRGLYKCDLEAFAQALRRSKMRSQLELIALRDEIVAAGVTDDVMEAIRRVQAGESGEAVVAEIVRRRREREMQPAGRA